MRIETIIPNKRWGVDAPAKVNLFFEILGKREDGYHEIETVAAPISLYDRLEFERAEFGGITLACCDVDGRPLPEIPIDERNLVAKVCRAFCGAAKLDYDSIRLNCKIIKRIPSQAGLGGGSSDAAAALAVLDLACGTAFGKSKLQEIAATVGSDVPLFLEDGASVGRGRGEVVDPISLPTLWLVVLKPVEGLSTPTVYRSYAEATHSEIKSLNEFCLRVDEARECANEVKASEIVSGAIFNRLEEPAAKLWNGLELRRALFAKTAPLAVQMSGSGSAVFAVYRNETEAFEAAKILRKEIESRRSDAFTGDRVYVVKTL